jgi:hypothetical protein
MRTKKSNTTMATKQAKYATAAMKVKRAMPAKFMEI